MSREIFLQEDSLITSKTDLKGKIVYANDDFKVCRLYHG